MTSDPQPSDEGFPGTLPRDEARRLVEKMSWADSMRQLLDLQSSQRSRAALLSFVLHELRDVRNLRQGPYSDEETVWEIGSILASYPWFDQAITAALGLAGKEPGGSFDERKYRTWDVARNSRDDILASLLRAAQSEFHGLIEADDSRKKSDATSTTSATAPSSETEGSEVRSPVVRDQVQGFTLNVGSHPSVTLDGENYSVTVEQMRILQILAKARGGRVPKDELQKYRGSEEDPGKTIQRMPGPIRALIEGKRGSGGGRRLTRFPESGQEP